jgi:hypothetical protein
MLIPFLKLSIESESVDAIKVLLEAGANPNIGDEDGMLSCYPTIGRYR